MNLKTWPLSSISVWPAISFESRDGSEWDDVSYSSGLVWLGLPWLLGTVDDDYDCTPLLFSSFLSLYLIFYEEKGGKMSWNGGNGGTPLAHQHYVKVELRRSREIHKFGNKS